MITTCRFQYASTTLLVRFRYDAAAQATVLLRCRCASVALVIFQDASATTMKIRLVYTDGDGAANLLRPRRWSYAFVPFYNFFYYMYIIFKI